MRIAEAAIPRLPAILRGISPPRIAALQAGLAIVRSRFGYGSIAHNELRLTRQLASAAPPYLTRLAHANEESEDAFQTMMRVLLHRAATRRRAPAS